MRLAFPARHVVVADLLAVAVRDPRWYGGCKGVWVDMNDLKFAFRQLLKNPGFTAVAVLTLALGIGANTAIFTIINTVLLRSLPVKNPEELVQVVVTSGSPQPTYSFSYPLYERLRDNGNSLSGLFAAGDFGLKDRLVVPNGGDAETEFVRAQSVSGG